jgi:SSS family solute:Na+ symporter
MELVPLDYWVFTGYILIVVILAMAMSRRARTSEEYFLGGRRLSWGLIGISLVASGIATEHFLPMGGPGDSVGLAYASYQWMAAVAMVLVALFLLPRFLRRGIYTIPEYLESRFSAGARGLMAVYVLAVYVFVIISAVLYAGATWTEGAFRLPLVAGVWAIGLVAGLYTVWGGLRAVVWAGLASGLGLIAGGAVITVAGLLALGDGQGLAHGASVFLQQAGDKLHPVEHFNHRQMPWVAVFIGGLWVLHLFRWGLDQSTIQRTLGAKGVAEGQKGMLFGATLKLLIPFIVLFPAMIALQLSAGYAPDPHRAYPYVVCRILPMGLRGLLLATLVGAALTSIDAMLHSASTILTVDFYKRYLKPAASDRSLARLGRMAIVVLVILACLWAPQLGWIAGDRGVFHYVQKTWGFLVPGIAAVFLFGLSSKRTPAQAAIGAMLLGPAFSAWCLKVMPEAAFLHHLAFAFLFCCAYMFLVTALAPLREEEATSGRTIPSERPAGLRQRTVIPFVTAIVGAYLLGLALFHFSWITIYQMADRWGLVTIPDWIHFANAGVPTAIYFAAALGLMRLPAPSIRLVAPGAVPPARRVLRAVGARAAAVVAAVVVGMHVYMFCLWVIPEWPPQDYWQGYHVNLTAIGTGQPVITEKPVEEDVDYPPPDMPDPTDDAASAVLPPLPAASEEGPEERVITVYPVPLLIGAGSAVVLLVVLAIFWVPAAPEFEPEPAAKPDATPSRCAPLWGVVIVAAVVLLYCLFLFF